MAVITGRYESHLSIALLPKVNDWRHRNFHDGNKKKSPMGTNGHNSIHVM